MTYLIAEIGQNHQGSIDIAKKMVDQLSLIGVDCIKTAKRDIDTCLTEEQKNMPYDNKNSFGPTYYEHRKALELSKDDFIELKNYVESKGIDFTSSFTDLNSLDFLNEIGVKTLKIASQRTTDIELLKEVSNLRKRVYLSTGMCKMYDVMQAVEILENNNPVIFQCTSSYPTEDTDLHLRVLESYKDYFPGYDLGFSSHSLELLPDVLAYSLGATYIERHFTLNRNWKGTDHQCSLNMSDLTRLKYMIEQAEKMLGYRYKNILNCELPAIKKLRK